MIWNLGEDEQTMAWTSLCELGELKEDQGKYVQISGFSLAVFLHHSSVYVMDNECPHAGGNLSGGAVHDGCAVCPWHSWAFELHTGNLAGTPGVGISTYKARVHNTNDKELVQADLPIY